ncbi:LPXTG cell wall anchor domain-containing protein [Candidatus Amarolinea dominans]|uniref:LPXTG cell wall anchor domain-containing protein n=1 Tax=Candidatus Amarolinea dominans TaxID=3140696 RepID=UPI0031351AA6|nr:LPXTG cell wall anchor domain-containing protein [Anaerolineae bacterium]
MHLPVVGNNLLTIGAALILIALLSLVLWRRNRDEMRAFVRANRGLPLIGEAVFRRRLPTLRGHSYAPT